MGEIKVGSFFSGIGAFEKALERLEIPHEMVFYCEIDKYASKAYSLIHNVPESFNLWDITKVNERELPDFDLMTWGFPCTDISVAGKQEGFIDDEGNKTRSGLYYDGLRILKAKMPKFSIIENVKNLTSEKFRPIFHQILCDLEDTGYHSYYEVLNAKDYGIPQNRERVFIVSIRKDIDDGFAFPLPFDNGLRLRDLLEDGVDEKYFINQEKTEKLLKTLDSQSDIITGVCNNNHGFYEKDLSPTIDANYFKGFSNNQSRTAILINRDKLVIPNDGVSHCLDANYHKGIDNHAARTGVLCIGNLMPSGKKNSSVPGRVYDSSGLCPTIRTPTGGLTEKNKEPILRDNCPTLRSQTHGNLPMVAGNYRIRKLTPLECFRLMGFDDADYWLCKDAGISDSQLYKMAGNSIVVQVLEGILSNLLRPGVMLGSFYGEQLALFG